MVVQKSSSELEQAQWSKKKSMSKDWVVCCRSRKKGKEQLPFDVPQICSKILKQTISNFGGKTMILNSKAKKR